MKKSIFPPLHIAAVRICIAGICAITSMNLQAEPNQVGRYSMLATTPTKAQVDLLKTIVMIKFPEQIQTLGEAVRHLLQHSGYRLAKTESMHPDADRLFALPLPDIHRSLGPMPLRTALETLAGPAFVLVEDPVHRLVAFDSCTQDQPMSVQR